MIINKQYRFSMFSISNLYRKSFKNDRELTSLFHCSSEDAVQYLSTVNERSSLVFYDPCYQNAIENYSKTVASSHLIFSKINTENLTDESTFSLYGRSVQLPIPLDPSNYSIIFISSSNASLNNFALYFHAYDFQ